MSAGCYSRILAHYPYVVIGAVSIFAATCLVVTITVGESPDFSDPRLGFEARGTDISNRIRSYDHLLDQTQNHVTPVNKHLVETLTARLQNPPRQSSSATSYNSTVRHPHDEDYLDGDDYLHFNQTRENYFCDNYPTKQYSRIVFESTDGQSLFTYHHVKAMCSFEEKYLRSQISFANSCITTTYTHQCCRSWSLGNYIALLSNRSSCYDITEDDVKRTIELSHTCAGYYQNLSLVSDCYESLEEVKCKDIPKACILHNAMYIMFHYIADVNFMKRTGLERNKHLNYAMTLLPMAAGIASEEIYTDLEQGPLSYQNIRVVAVNFGVKQHLFDKYLLKDVIWFGIAFLLIFLVFWLYTTSLFLTIMTLLSVLISLQVTYFIYTMVFEIKFFPFMNLLACVIIIGIGADDMFIYCKVWVLAKLEKNPGTLEKVISDTLRHATLSMFVTSLTTAAAFYASVISHITALSCFAVFAGTAVIINFLMMVTWIPAAIVIHDKWCSDWCYCYNPDFFANNQGVSYHVCKVPYKVYYLISDWSRIFFEKILPCIIIKMRYLWIFLLGCLGLGGILVVFYYPKLRLPSSNEFQLFAQDHLFEMYDFKMKELFWFEKASGFNAATMPLTVVWGAKAEDNGDRLDPFSKGTLVYDDTFRLGEPDAQMWLLRFCRNLRSIDFYQSEPGLQLTNCFIEHFRRFIEDRPCYEHGQNNSPCCKTAEFPYSEDVFNQCLRVYMPLLEKSRVRYHSNPLAGPRYAKDTGRLVALLVDFNSREPFSFNYEKIQLFYNSINQFVNREMDDAPSGMRNGWFVSHLEFYDLQESIAQGTPIAVAVAIAITFVVAFLTTLNVFITIFAILSIAFSIFVTTAALVLLGWELNILESVTISVAVGLSIDFTLHYGMAYRLSPDLDRETRVVWATARMGSPVTLAALTTFLAGAIMMPSTVLAYQQLGTFLMLVMTTSWLYATLFFQSLLRTVGPQGGFGQFHCPATDCCESPSKEHVDKTIYAMSESTLSSSSTNHANSSETHELEPLTDRDATYVRVRQPKPPSAHSNGNVDRGYRRHLTAEGDDSHTLTPRLYGQAQTLKSNEDARSSLLAEEQTNSNINRISSHSDVWIHRDDL